MDILDKQDVEEAFRGKLWTYVAVINRNHALGIAVANERGYSPVPYHFTSKHCGDDYTSRKELAKKLNLERGQSENEALNIIASSIAQQQPKKQVA